MACQACRGDQGFPRRRPGQPRGRRGGRERVGHGTQRHDGAKLWSATDGGPVTASASLNDGTVYIGSGDGNVYALSESTGSQLWKHSTGAAITTSGSLLTAFQTTKPSAYVVGNANGDVDELALGNGAQIRNFALGGPIAGVSSTVGTVIAQTDTGRVVLLKYTDEISWSFTSSAGYASNAAIVNGCIFLTGLDQTVTAFTTPGVQIP